MLVVLPQQDGIRSTQLQLLESYFRNGKAIPSKSRNPHSRCCLQAVHDEVPPDALTPLLRQLVDQFVHDRARPEVMSLGLKTVRSLCERAPLVMTPELLQVFRLTKA